MTNKLTLAIITVFICMSSAFSTTDSLKSPQKTVPAGKFTFTYSVEGENLVARVSYPKTCWIAVGFNPKMVMKDANIIIGTIVDGKGIISDEYGTGMFSHKADTTIGGSYNINSASMQQENNTTTMTFTIPLDSKDSKDQKLEKGKTIKVIFSSGKSNDTTKKHVDDAKTTITLE